MSKTIWRGLKLMRSELTGRIYGVTAWHSIGPGQIEAVTKHDVTDDFMALARELGMVESVKR